MFSAVESFLFISCSGFSCFCHKVCSRTRQPQKVLISIFFEELRLYLTLSTFLSITCAQGTNLIKQFSKVSTKTYHWSLKVVLLFLEANCYLDLKLVAFSKFSSNVNRQQRAVFYLESSVLISGISGFSFFDIEHIWKPGNHEKFL